jgi:hypothetical protein
MKNEKKRNLQFTSPTAVRPNDRSVWRKSRKAEGNIPASTFNLQSLLLNLLHISNLELWDDFSRKLSFVDRKDDVNRFSALKLFE